MAILKIKAIKNDGSSYWPDRWPVDRLEQIKGDDEMGSIRFSAEYQCEPISLEGNFLKRESLRFYDWEAIPKLEDGSLDLDFYYGFDPSISGHGDFCVICILGKSRTNQIYIIDFIRKQADLEGQRDLLQSIAPLYPPKMINIEDNAAQQFLVQYLQANTPLPIRSSPTRARKEERFANMASLFESGRVLVKGQKSASETIIKIHPSMDNFLLEWVSFPDGKYDDTLDAVEKGLEVAVSLIPAQCIGAEPPDLNTRMGMYWGKYRRYVRRL